MELTGKHVVFIVENCSVPFDPRVWREAKSLKKIGCKISVISPLGFKRDEKKYEVIDDINIYRYQLPINNYSKFGYFFEYLKSFLFSTYFLLRIGFKSPINAIHIANPPDIFFPLGFMARIFGVIFIFDHHDLSPESFRVKFGENNRLIFKLLLIMEYFSMKVSNCVVTTNESLKDKAIKRNGVPNEKVVVVRNGPDAKFRTMTQIKRLNRNNYNYIVSYIGNMGEPDGVENIIYAADYICNHQNRRDIQFFLIGYGDRYDSLLKLTDSKNLNGNVVFTNRIEDKEAKQILYSSDVCLSPDPRNGLNEFHTMNKVAEYMAFGKPIVSFNLDESIFTAKEAAIYVKNNDPHKFGEAIISLINDEDKRKKMGEIGRDRLEKFFTWEKSEIILQSLYLNLFKRQNKKLVV